MANWKLKDLRGESRRNFLKMATSVAAAVGIERSQLLNFLSDEGGNGLAEAAGSSYGRSVIVPSPNGSFAWFQELWPVADVGLKACQNANVSGLTSQFGGFSSYLYTSQYGYNPVNGYRGTYTAGKGASIPSLPVGVKNWTRSEEHTSELQSH